MLFLFYIVRRSREAGSLFSSRYSIFYIVLGLLLQFLDAIGRPRMKVDNDDSEEEQWTISLLVMRGA
jgi:hypothetical protein